MKQKLEKSITAGNCMRKSEQQMKVEIEMVANSRNQHPKIIVFKS